jgi:hypothetical protein
LVVGEGFDGIGDGRLHVRDFSGCRDLLRIRCRGSCDFGLL